MTLLNDVEQICDRLAPHGWADLLAAHGLDITAGNLRDEFSKELGGIDRDIPGFEDFALEGRRGIEPGHPARSLLYHAFTSPNVLTQLDGSPFEVFPTMAELDSIENLVYGIRPPTLADLRARAAGAQLAIGVFCHEYRPSSHTCHRKHADLAFARTGVSRIGTQDPLYDTRRRGFLPFVDGSPFEFRVCPARFGVYLAVATAGNKNAFCPMRFDAVTAEDNRSDIDRVFWLPIHKLFPGTECLQDFPEGLEVDLTGRHFNEKIKRIHIELGKQGFDTGAQPEDLDTEPFNFTEGIAELSNDAEFGPGLLIPVPHARLVEPAFFKGQPLTFNVPQDHDTLSSSLSISGKLNDSRHAPEFVHVRERLNADGTVTDLNQEPNVVAIVRAGGYKARHFVDFTGDGWIVASCPKIAAAEPTLPNLPAYSLVTAPDFFTTCDQRELTEWANGLPVALRNDVWEVPPRTLSDQRLPANLQLPQSPFDKNDRTLTAIVSLFGETSTHATNAKPADALRHSPLPDDSAGVFAPGWDVSRDQLADGTTHLAAYGLGSPFPEDAKLCAALSTFWPAAAPDATRTIEPEVTSITVSPLTDEEIGQEGNLPWDGIRGPVVIAQGQDEFAEYSSFAHADYVQSALQNQFTLALTSRIGFEEYTRRVLSMTLAYKAIGGQKADWLLLSFRRVSPGDMEFQNAQQQAGLTLPGRIYRFEMFSNGKFQASSADFRKRRIKIKKRQSLFIDPENRLALIRTKTGPWQRGL